MKPYKRFLPNLILFLLIITFISGSLRFIQIAYARDLSMNYALAGGFLRPDDFQDPAPENPLPPPIVNPIPEPPQANAPELATAPNSPSYEDLVMEIVNEERWANGQRPPLKRNSLLDASAFSHSANMAQRDFFAHCDLDTKASPWDRMRAAGYIQSSGGENIAAGYSSPTAVMNGWMNSSGHRSNILSTSYRELGIGYDYQSGDQGNIRYDNGGCTADGGNHGPYYNYWTQNFGRRNDVYPVIIDREAYETGSQAVDLYMYGEGWAEEMRFCNANGLWSDWQPYAPDVSWTLPGGNGYKTVLAEIRSGDTVRTAEDIIYLNLPANLLLDPGDWLVYMPVIAHSTHNFPSYATCMITP